MLSLWRKAATWSALLGPVEGEEESEEILGIHHYGSVSSGRLKMVRVDGPGLRRIVARRRWRRGTYRARR